MLIKFLIFISIAFFGSKLLANSPTNVCEDLAAATCAAADRNDGTGTSTRVAPGTLIEKAIEANRQSLAQEFSATIKGDEGTYLREMALSAFDLRSEKVCAQSSSPACVSLISGRMVDLYKDIETSPDYVMDQVSRETTGASELNKLAYNGQFREITERFSKSQYGQIPTELETRLKEKVFPNVLSILQKRVQQLPIDEAKKSYLVSKLGNVTYKGIDCAHQQKDSSGLRNAFLPNAYFEPETNEFYFCRGYPRFSSSEFDLAYVIAHELSHAIDPCGLPNAPVDIAVPYAPADNLKSLDDQYLRKDFLSCLRSQESVGAVRSADTYSGDELIGFCSDDQVIEGVSDWFASEVIGTYTEKHLSHLSANQRRGGFANILRNACSGNGTYSSKTHPALKNRINGVLLVQPQVRSSMGCAAPHSTKAYCDINDPAALSAIVNKSPARSTGASQLGASKDNGSGRSKGSQQ